MLIRKCSLYLYSKMQGNKIFVFWPKSSFWGTLNINICHLYQHWYVYDRWYVWMNLEVSRARHFKPPKVETISHIVGKFGI
jgi:hypothetical protein